MTWQHFTQFWWNWMCCSRENNLWQVSQCKGETICNNPKACLVDLQLQLPVDIQCFEPCTGAMNRNGCLWTYHAGTVGADCRYSWRVSRQMSCWQIWLAITISLRYTNVLHSLPWNCDLLLEIDAIWLWYAWRRAHGLTKRSVENYI